MSKLTQKPTQKQPTPVMLTGDTVLKVAQSLTLVANLLLDRSTTKTKFAPGEEIEAQLSQQLLLNAQELERCSEELFEYALDNE